MDIFNRSGDIRAQIGKESEIGPNFVFRPGNFLRAEPQIFGPAFIN